MKRTERDALLQQRLAAVGEMAAGIAHEIRNPLASMSGSIQILRADLPLDAEQEQLMDIVLRESDRLNTTIKSFLAYARPQRFAIARVDLRRVLQDAAMLLRNSADVHDSHRVDLDVPDEPVWFEADEGQIKQIVWNLCTNALRAMPDGGRLGVGASMARTECDQGSRRRCGHRPRGSGRALPAVPRQLRQGERARAGDRSSNRHRLQGSIRVDSTPGLGTTFSVRLPARDSGR